MIILDDTVTFKVTQEEKQWFWDYCKKHALNRSGLIRKFIADFREQVEGNGATA